MLPLRWHSALLNHCAGIFQLSFMLSSHWGTDDEITISLDASPRGGFFIFQSVLAMFFFSIISGSDCEIIDFDRRPCKGQRICTSFIAPLSGAPNVCSSRSKVAPLQP